jgi:hypothetical protein
MTRSSCKEPDKPRIRPRLVAISLVCLLLASPAAPAFAVTAELAKKCSALLAKNFPPREPTNPAAGSAKGSGADQRAFFEKCIASGGKVDDSSAK